MTVSKQNKVSKHHHYFIVHILYYASYVNTFAKGFYQ